MHTRLLAATVLGGALLVPAAHAQVTVTSAGDMPYCREYQQTVTIGGTTQQGHGTACLQPDGSWQIATPPVSDQDAAAAMVQQDVAPANTIAYVAQDDSVYMVPPQPFITGSVWIGGSVHHFDRGFRPHHNWGGGWHGHHH